MKTGPKYKICKRLGAGVFDKCQTQKFALAEARGDGKKKGKTGGFRGGSAFGAQLMEKQKARFAYGVSERQFFRYVEEALAHKGSDSAHGLTSRLEARLDNVVYRLGFAATRRQARQLVAHGHIMVNGRRLTVPSYKVEADDVVSVRQESRKSTLFTGVSEKLLERSLPSWLTAVEGDLFSGKVVKVPEIANTDLHFDPAVIIQFYSR